MEDLSLALLRSDLSGVVAARGDGEPTGNVPLSSVIDLYLAAVRADDELVRLALPRVDEEGLPGFVEAARVYRVNTLRAASGLVHSILRSRSVSDCSGSQVSGSVRSGGSAGSSTVGSGALRGLLRARALGSQTALARLPNGLCYLRAVRAHAAEDALEALRKFPTYAKVLSRPAGWYHGIEQLDTLRVSGVGSCKHLSAGSKGVKFGQSLIDAAAGRDWPVGSLGASLVARYPGRTRSSETDVAVRVGGVVDPGVISYPVRDWHEKETLTVFLAGSCESGGGGGWRQEFTRVAPGFGYYSPRPVRLAGTWAEFCAGDDVESRVEWERGRLASADIVVFNFLPGTTSRRSLVELGMALALGRPVVVCCPPGFGAAEVVRQYVSPGSRVCGSLAEAADALKEVAGGRVPAGGLGKCKYCVVETACIAEAGFDGDCWKSTSGTPGAAGQAEAWLGHVLRQGCRKHGLPQVAKGDRDGHKLTRVVVRAFVRGGAVELASLGPGSDVADRYKACLLGCQLAVVEEGSAFRAVSAAVGLNAFGAGVCGSHALPSAPGSARPFLALESVEPVPADGYCYTRAWPVGMLGPSVLMGKYPKLSRFLALYDVPGETVTRVRSVRVLSGVAHFSGSGVSPCLTAHDLRRRLIELVDSCVISPGASVGGKVGGESPDQPEAGWRDLLRRELPGAEFGESGLNKVGVSYGHDLEVRRLDLRGGAASFILVFRTGGSGARKLVGYLPVPVGSTSGQVTIVLAGMIDRDGGLHAFPVSAGVVPGMYSGISTWSFFACFEAFRKMHTYGYMTSIEYARHAGFSWALAAE